MRDLSARCVTEGTDNEPLAPILLEDLEQWVLSAPGCRVLPWSRREGLTGSG